MTPAVATDDLLQDASSWLQVVGEGSLKFVDPSLEKGHIWLEGQSRWDGIIGIKAQFAQRQVFTEQTRYDLGILIL